ncbi:MAG: hypothetical protein ACFNO7_00670 [Bacteroides sp.]
MLYLLFVALSALLWFLNKLNHEYTIEVARTVLLDNTPFGLRVVDAEHNSVTYRIKGHGYALMSYRGWAYTSPIHINYRDSLRRFSSFHLNGATLSRQDLSNLLSRHLPPDLQLIDVVSDSLSFQFGWQIEKRLPLRAKVTYTLADQCMLVKPIELSRDSIDVIGTEDRLDSLVAIETVPTHLGMLSTSVTTTLPLDLPVGVSASQKAVDVFLTVEQYTEKTLRVPIMVQNDTDSLHLKLVPTTVDVVCNIPVSYYDSLNTHSLRFWTQLDTLQQFSRLQVQFDPLPYYVRNLRFHPMYVGYYVSRE